MVIGSQVPRSKDDTRAGEGSISFMIEIRLLCEVAHIMTKTYVLNCQSDHTYASERCEDFYSSEKYNPRDKHRGKGHPHTTIDV